MNIDRLSNHVSISHRITRNYRELSVVPVIHHVGNCMADDLASVLRERMKLTYDRLGEDIVIQTEFWVFTRDEMNAFVRQIQMDYTNAVFLPDCPQCGRM